MTANIAFWRDKQHSAPAYIYRRLRCGWRLPTLEQLPVSGICKRIPEAFLQWQEELEREGLAEHGWYHAGKRRWMHRVIYPARRAAGRLDRVRGDVGGRAGGAAGNPDRVWLCGV